MKQYSFNKNKGLCLLACISFTGIQAQAQPDAVPPNLIFVLVDQLRYDAIGCNGSLVAQTPNLDKFRENGLSFSNALAVTPVSSAMRASLFTGKYTSGTGMVINELRLNPDHQAFGHVLSDNGYNTAYYGKWHLYSNCSDHNETACAYIPPGRARLGFDGEWRSFNFRHDNYNGFYYEDTPDKVDYEEGEYEPEIQFNWGLNYIERATTWNNQPFALFLSIGVPHDPWTKENVPQVYYDKFEGVDFPLPETWSDIPDPYMDRYRDPELWISYYKAELPEMQRVYHAMTASIDDQMGRLMAKVKELGLAENTIVVFISDHGEMFGEHGRIQKLTFYEAAAKVPFFINWEGKIDKNRLSDICINSPDIMPTLLGMMHLPIPAEVEGKDLSEQVLTGKGYEPEFALMQGMGHTYLWEDGYEWRAVRNKQFTYAVYRVDGKELLFDNRNDPKQKVNLADHVTYSAIKEVLKNKMREKMKELNDPFEKCTWYKEHWVDDNRCIQAASHGKFRSFK